LQNALAAIQHPEGSKAIFDRRNMETLSADSVAQEWCKSALSLQNVHLSYYPAEDSLLVLLDNEDGRNAGWSHAIERYMPFGDFYELVESRQVSGPGNAYTLEPRESSVEGKRNSVASGADALICARSAGGSAAERAEVSAYVDGHVLALRPSLIGQQAKKDGLGLVSNKSGVSTAGVPESANGTGPLDSGTTSVLSDGSAAASEVSANKNEQNGKNFGEESLEGAVKSRFVGSMEDGSVVSVVKEDGAGARLQHTGPSAQVVELDTSGTVMMFDATVMGKWRKVEVERRRREGEGLRIAEEKKQEAERNATKMVEARGTEASTAESKSGKGGVERPATGKGKGLPAKPPTPSKADAAAKKEANAKSAKGGKEAAPVEKPVKEAKIEVPSPEPTPNTDLKAEAKTKAPKVGEIADSEEALREVARGVTSSGAVVRILKGGGVQVLYPDGNIAERNPVQNGIEVGGLTGSSEGYWVVTNNAGERTAVYDVVADVRAEIPLENADLKSAESAAAEAIVAAAEATEKKPKEERAKTPKEGAEKNGGAKVKEAKNSPKAEEAKPLAENGETVTTAPEPSSAESVASGTSPEAKKAEPKPLRVERLPPIRVVEVTDPETGVKVLTREDLTMVLLSEGGSQRVVHFADGTRISSSGKGCENWQVQKDGFPTVRGRAGVGISCEMGQSWRATWAQSDSQIVLRKQAVGSLSVLKTSVMYATDSESEEGAESAADKGYVFDMVSYAFLVTTSIFPHKVQTFRTERR
jgi:hypothetical protein